MATLRSLIAACLVSSAPLTAFADCSADSPTVPGPQHKALREFEAQTTSAPFYRELAGKSEAAASCALRRNGDNMILLYTFANGGRLQATVNPVIEFAEQRAAFHLISEQRALALLRDAEKHAFGPDGCGIEWEQPEKEESAAGRSSEIVYRGDTCNCQARQLIKDGRIIALVLRSAC